MIFDCWNSFRRINRRIWIYLFCVLLPLIFSPLAMSSYKESKCGYVMLLVGSYWLLEPSHVAATAFLPIILFPVLGVVSSREICNSYMTETFMMFIGGLIVAVAVEDSKLHERIALKVLLFVGTEFKWLLMSFMVTTMFLSMWINNMSTAAMMVPIVQAIIEEISKRDNDIEMGSTGQAVNEQMDKNKAEYGSVATRKDLYPESSEITFTSWLMYNVPGMLICVFIAWIYLWSVYIRLNKSILKMQSERNIKKIISKRYDDLPHITTQETEVLILFLILVFLWIFRDPKFISGWAVYIGSDTKIGDSFPAILIAFLLFFLPANPRQIGGRPILEWKAAQRRVPWGVIILVGGGFALANAAQKSGLSKMIGAQLSALSVLPPVATVSVICFMTALLTEIMSNTATATILLPVIYEMATSIGVNPLYLMIPVTVVCSYAFMLPVATPPNAVAFESGNMRTVDMAKPGLVMNLVCCSVQLLMINTLGIAIFDLNSFPSWANKTDSLNSSVAVEVLVNATYFVNSTPSSFIDGIS